MSNSLHAEDKEKMHGYNEVIGKADINTNSIYGTPIYPTKECSVTALQSMGNRLLDWFSVVMADASQRRKIKNKNKGKDCEINIQRRYLKFKLTSLVVT